MSDLDAARARHPREWHLPCHDETTTGRAALDEPCDASLFRDALDECEANRASFREWAHLRYGDLTADVTAARALADELATALEAMARHFHASHDPCECPSFHECHVNVCGRNKRALAKHHAAHTEWMGGAGRCRAGRRRP